jgi:hypothetical protein
MDKRFSEETEKQTFLISGSLTGVSTTGRSTAWRVSRKNKKALTGFGFERQDRVTVISQQSFDINS